ncbi:hypothetical protein ACWKWP_14205 [Agromyces soli]
MNTESLDEANALAEKTAVRATAEAAEVADRRAAEARTDAARAGLELVRRELDDGRLDLGRLDALAASRADERRSRAKEARRIAVEASADVARELAELAPAAPVLPADPMNVIIDRVAFIRSFADAGVVTDSHVGSLDSWAEYRFEASADTLTESGEGRLSFFTLWRNPRTESVVVNPGARLVVNAHLGVDADWNGVAAWFIEGSEARATVRARTTVWAMWDASVHAIVVDRIIADAGATGGFFGGDDSASIAFGEFLIGGGLTVPAQASILIEVELRTEWTATNGSIDLDAASGAFRVEVPFLILALS